MPRAASCSRSSSLGSGAVPEVGDVVAELGEEHDLVQRHRPGAEHPDRLAAMLVAVAVGAVHDVASPPPRQPLDGGQLVAHARRDDEPPWAV